MGLMNYIIWNIYLELKEKLDLQGLQSSLSTLKTDHICHTMLSVYVNSFNNI